MRNQSFDAITLCIYPGRQKESPDYSSGEIHGAGNVTRTHDLLITNQLLYRLSYTSKAAFWIQRRLV